MHHPLTRPGDSHHQTGVHGLLIDPVLQDTRKLRAAGDEEWKLVQNDGSLPVVRLGLLGQRFQKSNASRECGLLENGNLLASASQK